ncbi:MAG: Alanine dehydrogenase (EC [uncultured Thiotrichaceae bacterium]|uniref:Alanine dehydrogenase n=1 Tax=uncultured Thiotrichaceae bacterium TaxID=298394 RepID=A0A6S6UI19_9GAMM|nr:MAG: Alanine dehydrogenase (EC [uncultured Thiotrichaceae bacterium]
MIIGIPKEIKSQEHRVALLPLGVTELCSAGHRVLVQSTAGEAVGYSDEEYINTGANIMASANEVYAAADMIIKVKEPQQQEYELLRDEQILFCYLHLAAVPELVKVLLEKNITAIAYETVTDQHGFLPLLIPMSEIAGRLATQVGANALQMHLGGKGTLLGGVPGVLPANVVVLGAGIVGVEAARIAIGMGADVTILDIDTNRLRELDIRFGAKIKTVFSNMANIYQAAICADVLIGSVLIPGENAPKLITREIVQAMSDGSVLVDVAIDQGGCAETSKPTTHDNPTYIVDGVIHYCVANIPSACAVTATKALTNVTLRSILSLANEGVEQACAKHKGLANGLNIQNGEIVHPAVQKALQDLSRA